MELSLLIADDETVVREGIGKYIRLHTDRFQNIYLARNGQEALDIMMKYQPSIQLLDVQMPLMNGLEVMRRSREAGIPLHVMILSGYEEFRYAQEALRMGAKDYLLKPTASSEILRKIMKLADEIYGPEPEKDEPSATGRKELQHVMVKRACKYLKEHYNEQISLKSTAEYLEVSPSYLSAVFSRDMGETFIDYLNRIRIEAACLYLQQNRLKVYEVAFKIGYRDEKYFTKVFHKLQGMSPAEYRKQNSHAVGQE